MNDYNDYIKILNLYSSTEDPAIQNQLASAADLFELYQDLKTGRKNVYYAISFLQKTCKVSFAVTEVEETVLSIFRIKADVLLSLLCTN